MQFRGPLACLAGALVLGACGGGGAPDLPEPRPVVVFSGARINAEPERMEEIHGWVTDAVRTIEEDPTFWLNTSYVPEPRYPWETLVDLEGFSMAAAAAAIGSTTVAVKWRAVRARRRLRALLETPPEREVR